MFSYAPPHLLYTLSDRCFGALWAPGVGKWAAERGLYDTVRAIQRLEQDSNLDLMERTIK